MPEAVFLLCALTSIACAVTLGRAYLANRVSLLFWSGICFTALAVNNVLLFVDLIVGPDTDLQPARLLVSLLGISALLYALVIEPK